MRVCFGYHELFLINVLTKKYKNYEKCPSPPTSFILHCDFLHDRHVLSQDDNHSDYESKKIIDYVHHYSFGVCWKSSDQDTLSSLYSQGYFLFSLPCVTQMNHLFITTLYVQLSLRLSFIWLLKTRSDFSLCSVCALLERVQRYVVPPGLTNAVYLGPVINHPKNLKYGGGRKEYWQVVRCASAQEKVTVHQRVKCRPANTSVTVSHSPRRVVLLFYVWFDQQSQI